MCSKSAYSSSLLYSAWVHFTSPPNTILGNQPTNSFGHLQNILQTIAFLQEHLYISVCAALNSNSCTWLSRFFIYGINLILVPIIPILAITAGQESFCIVDMLLYQVLYQFYLPRTFVLFSLSETTLASQCIFVDCNFSKDSHVIIK